MRLLRCFFLILPLAIVGVLLLALGGLGVTAQRFTPWRFSAAEAALARVVKPYTKLVRWCIGWQ